MATVDPADERGRGLGAAAIGGAVSGALAGAIVGFFSGGCGLAVAKQFNSTPPDPLSLVNSVAFFAGSGAAITAGGFMARRGPGQLGRFILFASGLVAPLAGALPCLSFMARRHGIWQWEVPVEGVLPYDPRFLAALGIAIAVGRCATSSGRTPVGSVGTRAVEGFLAAALASFLFALGFIVVSHDRASEAVPALMLCGLTLSAFFMAMSETVRPLGEWIEGKLHPHDERSALSAPPCPPR